jgi:tRNA (guanine10-N2)-methyltransferase
LYCLGGGGQGFFEVWGEGGTWEELERSIRSFPERRKAPFSGPQQSWKIVVDCWGRVVPEAESVALIESLAYTSFPGPVRLKDPENKFWLIIVDTRGNTGLPEAGAHPPPRQLPF